MCASTNFENKPNDQKIRGKIKSHVARCITRNKTNIRAYIDVTVSTRVHDTPTPGHTTRLNLKRIVLTPKCLSNVIGTTGGD